MINILDALLNEKIIDKAAYDTYMLYEIDERGRNYLHNACESILLEQPESSSLSEPYSWHDGRRSVWRDIKICIQVIKFKIEEYGNGRSKPTEYYTGNNPIF